MFCFNLPHRKLFPKCCNSLEEEEEEESPEDG